MEKEKKEQQSNEQQQQTSNEKNPTLNAEGTSVTDYGNVMGGSSNESSKYSQKTGTGRQDSAETMGKS